MFRQRTQQKKNETPYPIFIETKESDEKGTGSPM